MFSKQFVVSALLSTATSYNLFPKDQTNLDPVLKVDDAAVQITDFDQLVIDNLLPHEVSLSVDPDFNRTFQQIVAENGFIFESHPVTTKDGYILNVYRIRSKETKQGAPVVFLQHGIVDSADCWIMNYADVAPAFQLVRAGFDVWLGNQRGTKYSMGHTTLSNKSEQYWEFSFTEMGKYDAPA